MPPGQKKGSHTRRDKSTGVIQNQKTPKKKKKKKKKKKQQQQQKNEKFFLKKDIPPLSGGLKGHLLLCRKGYRNRKEGQLKKRASKLIRESRLNDARAVWASGRVPEGGRKKGGKGGGTRHHYRRKETRSPGKIRANLRGRSEGTSGQGRPSQLRS